VKHLAYLNKYLKKYKWLLVMGILFMIVTNYFAVIMTQVFDDASDTIEVYARQGVKVLGGTSIWQIGLYFFGVYLLYAIIKGFFLFLVRQTIIVTSRHIEYDLKNEIYDKYQALSYSFYKENSTGDIMNRISEDVSRVRMYLGPAIMYTINLVILFVMVISAMLWKHPTLTLYVLMPLPIMSYIVFRISTAINKKSEITQKQQSALSTFVQEAFSGIRVLKAFNRADYFAREFETENEYYRSVSLSLAKIQALFSPVIILLIGLSTVITVYVGGMLVINGEGLDVGDILQYVIYVNMLTWPFASVGWVSSLVQRAAASQKRINEFLHTPIEVVEKENGVEKPLGTIRFANVSFTYSNTGITALKNVTFELKPGQTLGITGRTGSGKSSVPFLLQRLFDVTEGSIMLDDTPIQDYDLHGLRNRMGYVPQEVFLFSDTIFNNIVFGKHHINVSQDEVEKVARLACVHDNIAGFQLGYQTRVGERGITLSGGQKQRISIARALIRKPELLIFDDCLSAVDLETEEKILEGLKEEMKGKTTIFIGNRISSLRTADSIMVLDKGEIAEMGTHQELLEKKGIYYGLYLQQLVDRNVEFVQKNE
jgi:ATP-binding cassette, subfamily B, multidrug efflux pump